MVDLKKYGITDFKTSVIPNDLIALANIEKESIDSRVIEIGNESITIENTFTGNFTNKYAVVGGEIVKILSTENIGKNTKITIEREQYGTKKDIEINSHFRTVVLLDYDKDIVLQSWDFDDTLGNVNSNLFPVELGSGTISLKSDLKLWSPHSNEQKYRVKPKKSIAYIFKGMDDIRFLKFTTVISKIRFNTRGKTEPNKIMLDIKTKLYQWYDKDLAVNQQLKGTKPKDFFKLLFGLNDNEIYYANGVTEQSFLNINNLHTKEYKTVSELLKAYCSNGVRFIFDAKERVKIFSDYIVDNIMSEKTVNYDITNLMLSENEQMIYNTISTEVFQRQPLYNFSDLDNKHVKYFKKLSNVAYSSEFLTKEKNGDIIANVIKIHNQELHSSVQLKDYVMFKRTVVPFLEFPAMVISISGSDEVVLSPILKDKDYRLFNFGKNTYLYDILVNQNAHMDLYFVRESLPIVFKYTRKKGNDEIDSNLNMPILPKVNGEVKYPHKNNITFGCASNLKVGQYTGIVEEIDGIYGIWNNSKLLYNRELEQFSNKNYPPIFALSNKMEEKIINGNAFIKNYTTFDNSNLEIEIKKPNDNQSDATINFYNTQNVNSDIDLMVGEEISRLGNKILEVSDLQSYKIGDVLILNRPDDLTQQEELEFDEVLSNIRWTIVAKEPQVQSDGTVKNYIFVDSPFAKRQSANKKYQFTKFPNWSIVYLQELYFRGNPVIEFSQEVVGQSKTVNYDGDTSIELYGEQKYDIDSKQLDKINLRKIMGYILHNFQATDVNTTKYNLPISVFNGIDIEVLDVISVVDPIYTQVSQQLKWLVLSVKLKSNTNEVELKLLNLNAKNTELYKLDIKDVLEYKPVEIPQYSHTGGEGNVEENNDGTGGTKEDPTLGKFWLAEVDPKKFRARVEKFEGNYIYFKDFNGEEVEQYKNALFPVSEFGVTIKGETIFVQSDMKYRAFIKKRRVYNTEESVITPEDEVTFLVTTTYVDIDGTFYGRKMMMGDGDNYLSVDPIKGVKVVGDFVVGENNKTPENDLWQSMQNNKTFQQTDAPVSTGSYILKEGDIWYDTDDGNHCYRYNGTVWVSARDGSIVSSQNTIFIQPDEPKGTEGRPLRENDTWYDSDDGNKPYVYKNGKWVNVTDMTLQGAIDKVQQQAEDSKNRLDEMAKDNVVTPVEKKQINSEIEVIKDEYPQIKSEAMKFGLTPTNYNKNYYELLDYIKPILQDKTTNSQIDRTVFVQKFVNYYNSRQDLLNLINDKIKDTAVNESVTSSKKYADEVVKSLGDSLQNQIDGKINTYNQENDPSLEWGTQVDKEKHRGDLWYKPSEEVTRRWNGNAWDILSMKDTVAQELAKSKKRVFTKRPTTPYDIGDLWLTNIDTNGDLMVCVTPKASGALDETNWKKATKYTDDTKANEAYNNATKAQEDADKANKNIADIISDKKITPNEKQELSRELNSIIAEFPKILADAKLYGTTGYDVFEQKYNSLKDYLTPILASMDTTTDINNPQELSNKFKEYYDERQNQYSKIYAKIKESSIKESTEQSKTYSDKIVESLGKDLTAQIDGKIESYNQEDDPSKQWFDQDKKKHIGDIWYIPSLKETKRWNGTTWENLSMEDKLAQEIAKSKKRVFSTEPTAPYEIGDLWISKGLTAVQVTRDETQESTLMEFNAEHNNVNSDLMICIKDNISGTFNSSDWIKATNYTDDTLANDAIDKAEKSQQQAEKANEMLKDIASDNKLTPNEKINTKKEWDEIQSEYNKYILQAKLYNVDSTNYTTKYNNLKVYIEPLLESIETTSNIEGNVFRLKFGEYYNARQDLLGTIYEKIKSLSVSESNKYTDKITTELGKDLLAQIDGKIDSYNQTTDPSLEWQTEEDKSKHKGDLWFNPQDKTTKRWNGIIWEEISVEDRVAQEIAKSKRRVFVEQPTIPYDIGDLWITSLNSNGDLKVCIKGKAQGVYADSDWIIATKYTDDTKANEAFKNAQTAQQSANKANDELKNMSSDNKLSPMEKQSTKKEVDIIIAEKDKNIQQAKLYGVQYDIYLAKYNELIGYVNPLLTDLSSTSDIEGSVFRAKFKDYYNSRQDLLNDIYAKIKELSIKESVQSSKDYADKITNALGKDLEKQIDGKINSFSQTDDPALLWTTSEEKQKHIGDLWYNPTTKLTQRWNGAQWEELSMEDSIAREIAQSKRKVFVKQPTTPYEIGDLWLTDVTNGDLMVCIKAKETGEYDTLDWKKATKYTDDTKANEAYSKAIQAQKDAEKVNKLVEDISSDKKITPNEKQELQRELSAIESEFNKILSDCKLYGTQGYDIFEAKYNALKLYLQPILSNVNTTTDIANPQELTNKFNEYYIERQNQYSRIYAKIKELSVSESVEQSKGYADKIVDNLSKDLSSQIDGKIESFNQENDPSESWNESEKQKHIGDIWYQPSAKTTKRWNGTQWENLNVEDKLAQELAKSKRRVFSNIPVAPYEVGDLWVSKELTVLSVSRDESLESSVLSSLDEYGANNSDLYICIKDNLNGEMNYSDWTKATNYTNDELANQAFDKAEQSKIQAEKANAMLRDIANDNKLTPDEKSSTIKEWEEIKSEYNKYIVQAKLYGVDYKDYDSKYNELNTYITPLLSNINETSDIDGKEFRLKFGMYYLSRQDLIGAMYEKIKQIAITESNSYADKVTSELGKDLSTQIDGKIDSFNQENDPSADWKTVEDKIKHKGDLWHKPSERITKRWNGEKWDNLEVKDDIANNLAQSKRRVFTVTPTVPYDIGDLWITDLTSKGDLKVCIKGKSEGTYSSEDWKIATKYTDDTKANEALKNANNAQISANESNEKLAEMSDDNKLSPIEKQNTKKEIDVIISEKDSLIAQAKLYGVTYDNYTNKYNTLINYITPLLSDLNSTSTINGVDFRNKFKEYYNSRQDLLNGVYAKIKELSIQESIQGSKTYADKIVQQLGKDLEVQIDGKINAYSQSTDPSVDWTTQDEKNKHKGDLWYVEKDNITKRWDGNKWINLNATDKLAQEIAKSKKQVFTQQPVTPYEVGDLWIKKGIYSFSVSRNESLEATALNIVEQDTKDNTDLFVCIKEKQSGEFDSLNWVRATNYTDDSVANQAQQNATEAQNSADRANSKLEDIASDNKLTPSEKQSTKKEWEEIVNEKPKNITQAQLFGIEFADYENKYNLLSSYITPLLSDLNSTSDINGSEFRTKFNDYYSARQTLLNNITKKAKELADNAQADATIALGNAKIFYQNDPPTSGMKENDLWYDTNDGNQPYIYKGGKWISARDKIFETEGGNKVYFQSTQPPTTGKGVKEGDQWFDTAHNNSQYVLINQGGTLVWKLASDANDKIQTGRVVLNANTTINGDFKVKGNNVELTGATKVNGILEVFSNNQGIISYNGVDEASSTQRIIIRGGEILFQEKI